MKSLFIAFVALIGATLAANAQCASGYTQLSNVYACQQNSTGAPVITSSSTATGTVGAGFNYQITATNSPTSYSAVGLPPPLAVNTSTGLINGTPTSTFSGNVTLGATNGSGTGNETLALTISSGASFNVGYTTTPTGSAGTGNLSPQTLVGSGPFTMPNTGNVQSISFFVANPNGKSFILAIYADSSGSPGALIAQTASTAIAAGWNTFSTTTNPSVTSGSKIWVAFVDPSSWPIATGPEDTGFGSFWDGTAVTSPPNPAANLHTFAGTYGAYATFH